MSSAWKASNRESVWPWTTNTGTSCAPVGTGIASGERNAPSTRRRGGRPQRIVVSGGSYGGGQSWDLSLSADKVVSNASTDPANPILSPWTSPRGTPLDLVAAAPMYPWTDLADALVQNGRAADGAHGGPSDGNHESPIGVDKQTDVAGLFADGGASAQYSVPGTDPTADLTTWNAGINAGEPYAANPEATTALYTYALAASLPHEVRKPRAV